MSTTAPPVPLGERLVARQVLSAEALDTALRQQRSHQVRLGELLVAEGLVPEEEVWRDLAERWDVPLVDLGAMEISSPGAAGLAPADAVRLGVVPFKQRDGVVWIAAADPTDDGVRDFITARSRLPLRWFAATPTAVRAAQLSLFGGQLAAAAVTALQDRHPEASAERQLSPRQARIALSAVALAVAALIIWRGAVLIAAMSLVVVMYAVWLAFRTHVIVRGARAGSGEDVASA
ncbi:protein containing General secretory system II, protein E, partial [mine drainage metagenome]